MGTRIYENDGDNVEKKYLAVNRHGTDNPKVYEYSIIVRNEIIRLSEDQIRDFVSKLSNFFITGANYD